MKNIEAITEVLTNALAQDPMFALAFLSLLLVGFSIYVLLAVVKLLIKKER